MASRHEPPPPPDRESPATAPPEREETDREETEPDTTRARDGADAGEARGEDEYTEALEELRERWRRALADLDNLRKRHARELDHERQAERARVLAALLPVIDNLELALAHAGADPESIVEGVKAVRDQAVEVLSRLGYPRQEETRVPFDPLKHEVVGIVDAPDAEPGTVVGVRRPGYGDPDHQLRPMAVTVSRAQE